MQTPDVITQFIAKLKDTNPFIDVFKCKPTGSAYTCSPPVTNTDEDWIVWTDFANDFILELEKHGYATSENQADYPDCLSFRNGNINIILIFDKFDYENWSKATSICKRLNLLEKSDRKLVHRIAFGEESHDEDSIQI